MAFKYSAETDIQFIVLNDMTSIAGYTWVMSGGIILHTFRWFSRIPLLGNHCLVKIVYIGLRCVKSRRHETSISVYIFVSALNLFFTIFFMVVIWCMNLG